MSTLNTTDHAAGILSRIIEPEDGDLSRAAAEAFLGFRLSDCDRARVNELVAGDRAGTLTVDERSRLADYERVTALIEIMQSKARRSIHGTAPSA